MDLSTKSKQSCAHPLAGPHRISILWHMEDEEPLHSLLSGMALVPGLCGGQGEREKRGESQERGTRFSSQLADTKLYPICLDLR